MGKLIDAADIFFARREWNEYLKLRGKEAEQARKRLERLLSDLQTLAKYAELLKRPQR